MKRTIQVLLLFTSMVLVSCNLSKYDHTDQEQENEKIEAMADKESASGAENNIAVEDESNEDVSSGSSMDFKVGDCTTANAKARLAVSKVEKVPCDSDRARSKVVAVVKDRTECSGASLGGMGDFRKIWWCLEPLG